MPPKSQSQRRQTQSQAEHVYDLGVAGRKTGLTLPERQRDEHGMEAIEDLFSSPEKDINNVTVNGTNGHANTDSDEEQDMEIDDDTQMGPATIMKQHHSQHRVSLPRGRSPIKTNLQSPARQNPNFVPGSSPSRGSIVGPREINSPKMVARRLDFSKSSQSRIPPQVNGHAKVNGVKARNGKLTNGHTKGHTRAHGSEEEEPAPRGKPSRRQQQPVEEDEDEEEEEEEPMQVLDDGGYDEVDQESDVTPIEPEPEEEEEPEQSPEPKPKPVQQPKAGKRRGRKPKSPIVQEEEREPSIAEPSPAPNEEVEEAPVKKRRGRPAKNSLSPKEDQPAKKSPKRRRSERNSEGSVEEEQEQEQEDNTEERETKRQKPEKTETKATTSKPTATKEKGKPGRKRKSSGIGAEEPVVQRGPPLPKSRGLVINRQEDDTMRTTRSGRLSYRPVEYWKGEHVLQDTGKAHVVDDHSGRKGMSFLMPGIKGVVRVADAGYGPPKRRRGRPAAKQAKRGRRSSTIVEEEVVERDEWEYDPGRVAGDCLFWRAEHELQAPDEDQLEVAEEELAVSEAAIQFKDIKDATFRFAKTLTLPFFGSGLVDMPPGSEKRTKNSRKMQMVFFVHSGSVDVRVAETDFRIGKGGMWFVPRGNHYSIANHTDKPARIFFAQGCEMLVQPEEDEGQE